MNRGWDVFNQPGQTKYVQFLNWITNLKVGKSIKKKPGCPATITNIVYCERKLDKEIRKFFIKRNRSTKLTKNLNQNLISSVQSRISYVKSQFALDKVTFDCEFPARISNPFLSVRLRKKNQHEFESFGAFFKRCQFFQFRNIDKAKRELDELKRELEDL